MNALTVSGDANASGGGGSIFSGGGDEGGDAGGVGGSGRGGGGGGGDDQAVAFAFRILKVGVRVPGSYRSGRCHVV